MKLKEAIHSANLCAATSHARAKADAVDGNGEKSQHTPGPWKYDRMFLGDSKDRRSGFVINGPENDTIPVRICDIRCSPESPFAVSRANAQLIAASPELLSALSALVSRIEYYSSLPADQRPCIEQWEYTEGSTEMQQARAAIAKAKGSL